MQRTLDARPDTIDFRDAIYTPTLVEVPKEISLEEYKKVQVPILDQGSEGACTGFGLASVANYLLRRRDYPQNSEKVSPRMLYEMAKRYDEWPGEEYSGSSARGAIKGWYKHGVCTDLLWPYSDHTEDSHLSSHRIDDAIQRPLGAYYRVNHKDIVSLHSALAEVGILYATASVHQGWNTIGHDGVIPHSDRPLGGHAFAIVAYDQQGFWIQNSWGEGWGTEGFAKITYDDWLLNSTDVWVARLGAPIRLQSAAALAIAQSAASNKAEALTVRDLQPHIISIGNQGRLRTNGTYGTSEAEVAAIFKDHFPKITQNWSKKRILLYAHGGLVDENTAIQRLSDHRATLLEAEVYPISIIWNSDILKTLENILRDALSRRRSENIIDAATDFMLDRLDDTLEPLVRLPGKALWDEMKENAQLATTSPEGGLRFALKNLADLVASDPSIQIHLVGHSAGAILHAPVIDQLTSSSGLNLEVQSCTLWAPACTVALFKQRYQPAIDANSLKSLAVFTLNDQMEQDDQVTQIYNKSILYLVSNAFEERIRIPGKDGVAILGMEKFIKTDSNLKNLFDTDKADWVVSQSNTPGTENQSKSSTHGGFDQDKATLMATLARITKQDNISDSSSDNISFELHPSRTVRQEERQLLDQVSKHSSPRL